MFPRHVSTCSPTHFSSFSASSTSSVLGNICVYPGAKRGYTCSPKTICTPTLVFCIPSHCQSTESCRWGFVPLFLPFSPQASSLSLMPCPSPGFNATNCHLVVAKEAKLAVGKKYCYQKKSARGGVLYDKVSKVSLSCPFRVHGVLCSLPTLPLCLRRLIQKRCTRVRLCNTMGHKDTQQMFSMYGTSCVLVFSLHCHSPPLFFVSDRRTTHLERKRAHINCYWVMAAKAEDKKKVVKTVRRAITAAAAATATATVCQALAAGVPCFPHPPLPL